MEFQTWVDFMELWTYLICSWVGFTTCNFTKILRKEGVGTNLQKTWQAEFLSKENIWEPIYIELEKKSLEQTRDGYPSGIFFEKEVSQQIKLVGATHKL